MRQLVALVHPIALQLSEKFSVHWYGVMVALGFLAGLWTASRRAPRVGVSPEKIFDLGPWLILGAIVGARFLYVVTFWKEQFAGEPFYEVFMIQRGGLVYYGGLIGAILAGIWYCQLKRLPVWKAADILAPSIALGHVFGRIGCLLNGCCYGRLCQLHWAIRFPRGSAPFEDQIARGQLDTGANSSLPVHPTQIYESLLNLGLYLGLAWMYRRKKFEGQVFAAYLMCYAAVRSFVEVFRGDYPQNQYVGGLLTPAQTVSIFIFVAGLVLFWVLHQNRPRSSTLAPSKDGTSNLDSRGSKVDCKTRD
jgi:phosphatidylglycerol:prolipoprotein diacylglycerol transferase